MDILFLGSLFPKHLESAIIENSKKGIQFSANNLQWALIDGLDMVKGSPVQLCNLMAIGSYPLHYTRMLIRTEKFYHQPGSDDVNCGFINLAGVSLLSRFLSSIRWLFKILRQKHGKKIIIIYSIHTPFLLSSVIIKLIFRDTRLCLIVPDLPQFMSSNKSLIYRMLKAVDRSIINLCLTSIDAWVLISDFMKEKLKTGEKPCIRIEGIFSQKNYNFIKDKDTDNVIMYAGNLDKDHGILNLLNAFLLIEDKNFILWIAGHGNGLGEILKASESDPRIIYWENLKQVELFNLMQRATLLVNPFNLNHGKTKYFFPSKNIEYMASGTPVLMNKLPSIPEEYNKYVIFFEYSSIEGIKDKILEICSKPQDELKVFGKKAQEFILAEKNTETQCNKILSMLERLFII